jgi:hypothetical protein
MLLGGMAGRVFAQTAPQRVTAPLTVASPNGALVVTLGTDGQLTWSVSLRGSQILRPSRIAMTLNGGRILGEKPVVSGTATQSADRILKPVVRIKRAEIRDHYNERVVEREDFIARTRGTREYPWRVLAISPGVDMEAIAAHAKQKNVGLIMWVIWKTLDLQMGPALDQFEKWGVKGITVDFMQREDQWMVNYYARDLDVDLSFLGSGAFQAEMFRDGANANRAGMDYAKEKQPVTAQDHIRIQLAPGGGWVARITVR